ncbi:ABC transporter B family member 9-like isoform X2 [Magnolia sinica]|uniref:ABC transporter B family member 9-like isoform X2 n=1 Tax=Magnolia sinica TaxID=86752 RepID=UPI002659B00A|nr:ABC transporter B family member 9-like isoform X2 [Magnolia sinica]
MEKRSKKAGALKGRDKKVPFHKLFSLADPLDVVLMCVGTVSAVADGLTMPVVSLIFGELINSFGASNKNNIVTEVSKGALQMLYVAAASGVASFLQVSCWTVTGERQAMRLRGLYLKTILRQDIAFFDEENSTGAVIGRMSGDTILIQEAMGEKVGKLIQLLSYFLGGFAVAFVKGWLLAVVMLSCIPPIVAAGGAMAIIISKLASKGQIAYAEAGNIVEQTIGSIRVVASFTGEKRAIMKYNESLKTAYKSNVKQGLATGLGVGAVMLIICSSYGLAVLYGSKLIIEKGYNGGDVITIMIAIMTGGMSLGQASPSINAIAAGQAAAYKMFKTINRRPEIDAYDTSGMVLEDIKGNIELRDVYFSYPSRPDIQVFSGFSLHVPSSTTVALVGESGSGKSTVISLVERFYDPQAGEVLIDGIDLKKLQLGWVREKIGLVSQEPILFMTTIKENIAYGKADATLAEIKTAIKLANAKTFIDKMPEGLDTMVGEYGTQLSGGQKQRIAIARAILKNPKILLLDEATSALDAESERIVQEALVSIMSNRTTVVVAHRLSTVRNADTIAVVHQGRIVEQGPHLELIANPDGVYSQLIHLQEMNNQVKQNPAMNPDKISSSSHARRSATRPESPWFSPRRSVTINSPGVGSSKQPIFGFHRDKGKERGDESEKTPNKVSIGRLAYLNKPELPVLMLGSVAAVVHGSTFPILGILLSNTVNIFYESPHKLLKDSRLWALSFVGLGIMSLAVVPLQQYLFGVAGSKLIQRIRSLSFERVVHQEISWFDDPMNSSGAIGGRLSGDASTVRSLVGDALALMVQNISTIIVGILVAMVSNWRLALIILGILPLVGLQGYLQMKFLAGSSEDAKMMYEEASQVANDAVGSIRTVASFCAEQKVMDLYKKKCEAPMRNGMSQGIISGIGLGFSNIVLFCSYALNFYLGAWLVASGKATFTEVFRVFFVLTTAAIGASQSSAIAPDATKAKESAASIFAILDRQSKIDPSKDKGMTLPNVKGDIEFQHVKFKYPTRPDVQIFRNLCLRISSVKTVALVGESGSGKSTAIALLQRFYDPDSGQILLDGVEIKILKLLWLRQQMGLVSQEPILFNDTIRANIAYGKQGEVSEDEIISAVEAANAHSFISSLPKGYNTHVGERGVQLSGGQKQRIAIARAVLKDPKVLLLDEATSALDAESEHVVQEALDRVMVNRSTIVVAHRLTTIKGADLIAVVKNGVIAEKGRHETLMKLKEGVYSSLVAVQSNSST